MLCRVLKKKVNIEETSFHSVWKIDSGSEWFGLISTTIFVIRVVHNISMTDIAVDKSTDSLNLLTCFLPQRYGKRYGKCLNEIELSLQLSQYAVHLKSSMQIWKIDGGSEWFGLISTTIFVIRVVHNISMTDIAVDKSTDSLNLLTCFLPQRYGKRYGKCLNEIELSLQLSQYAVHI